jgi:hypothetical protein
LKDIAFHSDGIYVLNAHRQSAGRIAKQTTNGIAKVIVRIDPAGTAAWGSRVRGQPPSSSCWWSPMSGDF